MVTPPKNINELVMYQLVSSLVFLIFQDKRLPEEVTATVLEDTLVPLTLEIVADVRARCEALIQSQPNPVESVTDEWIADIANAAVTENLTSSGEAKYDSAQGYACAISAVKLAMRRIGEEYQGDSSDKAPTTEQDLNRKKIFLRAKDLYDATDAKYGPRAAATEAFAYIAEQSGISTLDALGLSEAQSDGVKAMIIQAMGVS